MTRSGRVVVALGFLVQAWLSSSAWARGQRPKVTAAAAAAVALRAVPGRLRSQELEREHGRWIYSMIVQPEGGDPRFVKEVNVDAETGRVVEIETERAPR